MMTFAKQNIPIIHIYNINKLFRDYNLPSNLIPKQIAGTGDIFSVKKYNLKIAVICLIILILAVITVVVIDRHDRNFTTNLIDQDEDL
jgi:hypothetical protein